MLNKLVAAAAAAVALLSAAVAPARAQPVKNVVIVHGDFADGSGWQRVADIRRSTSRRPKGCWICNGARPCWSPTAMAGW